MLRDNVAKGMALKFEIGVALVCSKFAYFVQFSIHREILPIQNKRRITILLGSPVVIIITISIVQLLQMLDKVILGKKKEKVLSFLTVP